MVLYLRRFAFGQYRPAGKRCGLWWAERRFPSFRFEIVMHLVDTAPNDFRF